jgi:hypothetical protein
LARISLATKLRVTMASSTTGTKTGGDEGEEQLAVEAGAYLAQQRTPGRCRAGPTSAKTPLAQSSRRR